MRTRTGLPAVAAALGHPVAHLPNAQPSDGEQLLGVEHTRHAVVVLLDGLGALQLRRRGGHAPFLSSLGAATVDCGFPATTATSLASLGTGLPPGAHGLVGTEVLDPARGVVFSELAWDPAVDPRAWQPEPTVFEHLARSGVEVVRVGPGYFDGSGLTEAVQRGGRFVAGQRMADRVDAVTAAVAAAARRGAQAFCYLYWGEIDKVGHQRGCDSWHWGEELSAVDGELARLARLLPADALMVITADHGMVDVAPADRVDVALDPALAAGVARVGGEPRAVQVYCRPGAVDDVLAAWRGRLGDRFELLRRDEAVAAGWFGPVHPRVLPRIGDIVGSATGLVAVVDSRTARPEHLTLVGQHGARTEEEQRVPLLVTRGRRRGR